MTEEKENLACEFSIVITEQEMLTNDPQPFRNLMDARLKQLRRSIMEAFGKIRELHKLEAAKPTEANQRHMQNSPLQEPDKSGD